MSPRAEAAGKKTPARPAAKKKPGRKKKKGGAGRAVILAFIAGLLVAGAGLFFLRGLPVPNLVQNLTGFFSVQQTSRDTDKTPPPPGASAARKAGSGSLAKTEPSLQAAGGTSTPKTPAQAQSAPDKTNKTQGLEAGRGGAEDPVTLALNELQNLPYEEHLPDPAGEADKNPPASPFSPPQTPSAASPSSPSHTPSPAWPLPHSGGEEGLGGSGPLRGQKALLVIVMDDLGASRPALDHLLALNYPVTFAFWPHGNFSRAGAMEARAAGREVIIHQPMEPVGYPGVKPGPNVLMKNMAPEQIRARLELALAAVPGAEGLNNHMGSRFTQSADGVRVVIDFLKERGLFMLDSVTHPNSVFAAEARRMGLTAYRRDIFLDVTPNRAKILEELRKAEDLALLKGQAVAIGHPLPATLAALKDFESLRRKNIRLVRLQDLDKRPH